MALECYMLMLLFFYFSSCRTDPPRIQLATTHGSYTINEGDNMTILCYGDEQVAWRFPNRHLNCYDNTTGPFDIRDRLNVTSHIGVDLHFATVTLSNASYLDTGIVECFYNSSGSNNSSSADKFYLFVNSSTRVLMPCSQPEDLCKLPDDTRRKSVPIFLRNYSEFAPCKPISDSYLPLIVRTKSSAKETLATYVDPFYGFQLLNATDTIQTVECFYEGREDEKCCMNLNFASVDPVCSLKFGIIGSPRRVLLNANVTFQCEALCASVPTGYKLTIEPNYGSLVENLPFDKSGSLYRVRAEMTISEVEKRHSGSYTCNLTIPSLTSQVATFDLIVFDSVQPNFVVPDPTTFYRVTPSDLRDSRWITLDCRAFGTPLPHYRWFNGTIELNDQIGPELRVTTAVGNFTCFVFNSVGFISRSFLIKFEPEDENGDKSTNLTVWIIAIIAAVIFGVLISLFGVGFFGYIRLRQRNRNAKLKVMCERFELPWDNLCEIDIGQLEFKEILGQGAFGVVFKARMNDRFVAVKSIKDSYDLEQYAALCSEIKLLSSMGRHLNICNLVGAVTHTLKDGLLCMVLEYCDLGNLRHFLRSRRDDFESVLTPTYSGNQLNTSLTQAPYRLSSRDLTTFAYQIATGMQFLHDRHCLHRDLAARNILLCSGNLAKISDFGLAKDGWEYKKKGDGKVPFKWLAPECIRDKIYNKQTDIWAFGVLLWEIFTLAKDPYPEVESFDENFVELLENNYRLPRADFADDSIDLLINLCWHRDGKSRPEFGSIRRELAGKLPQTTILYFEEASERFLRNLTCLPSFPNGQVVENSVIYSRNNSGEGSVA